MYPKISGMTGTAITEVDEFKEIYNLDVIQIPTNMPNKRTDLNDLIYMKKSAKLKAILESIQDSHKKGQPILIGVTSVEKSEELSDILKKNKIKHNVLNAKNHAKEAEIINQAGKRGSVTIATNMAGRGTDIRLGGNTESEPENKEKITQEAIEIEKLGGLLIIGTERNESRRVDNQLRGRSGRQGSAGVTQFFLSLEDDLMCIFGGEKLNSIMNKLGMKDDEAISHKWVTGALDSAQKKVESYNYELRKNLIRYDDTKNGKVTL
ncbi:hypothetical protein IRJ41_013780 [Triplophysa rosa]|uniref:Protein translocase subunit SecA n=1 Tax=Triplophysa rosa TaxID=992332 RepID=A0A9W7T5W5_TRIRA|nr:hypothetical protein IRJ41_013780 [Triplophysa rosa]